MYMCGKFKRIIGLLLAVVLIFGMAPVSAAPAQADTIASNVIGPLRMEEEEENFGEPDPYADLETEENFLASLGNLKPKGPYNERLIAVAETQLGYTESERNFIVKENEQTGEKEKFGYTRYGAWYGNGFAYESWCAMFISFCLHYAGVPEELMPYDSGVITWMDTLLRKGLYRSRGEYMAKRGDLIFFDFDRDGRGDHVGIVESTYWQDGAEVVRTIEGNHTSTVEYFTYPRYSYEILGYGCMSSEDPDAVKALFTMDYLSMDGSTYRVTVTCDSDAGIPKGTVLSVSEISSEPYLDSAAEALGWGEDDIVVYTRFFDIKLIKDGVEIEPLTPVQVSIELLDMEMPAGTDGIQVVHFAEDGTEALDASSEDGSSVTFMAESFSPYGVSVVLRPIAKEESTLASVTLYSTSASVAPSVSRPELEAPEEGLETMTVLTVETGDETTGRAFVRAGLKDTASLGETESLALYAVEANRVTDVLVDELSADAELVSLPASTEGVALVKDTGYRRLNFELEDVALSGMMPKASAAQVSDVTEEYSNFLPENAQPEAEEEPAVVAAFDISITDGESDYQPDEEHPVTVEISSPAIAEAQERGVGFEIWHLKDDGSEEQISDFTESEGKLTFSAAGFSVYVIVEGETYLRTYRFYTLDEYLDYIEYVIQTDQGGSTATQTIRKGETPVVPQNPVNPQDPEATFAGWYEPERDPVNQNYTYDATGKPVLQAEPYDFSNIPEITENEEVRLYARFTSFAYVVFHDLYQSEDGEVSFPVAYTRRGELVNGSASVKVSDLNVTFGGYTSGGTTYTAKQMVFAGWSTVSVSIPGNTLNDDGYPPTAVTTDSSGCISVTGTVDLYPIFQRVYWLSFYSGPTGSGATYYPEKYYFDGVGPNDLIDHLPTRDPQTDTNKLYTFAGWYAGNAATILDNDNEVVAIGGTEIAGENGDLVEGASATGISVTGGRIVLTDDVVLYAAWELADIADYTVVIAKLKAVAGNTMEYEYAESFRLTGTIGDDVTRDSYMTLNTLAGYNAVHADAELPEGSDTPYAGYTANEMKTESSVTILADGSAVLYVYYDWSDTLPTISGTYTLTFADTLTGAPASQDLPSPVSAAYGTALTNPAEPTCGVPGAYSFKGWYADASCTTRVFFEDNEDYRNYTGSKAPLFNTMPGANLTVYAGWEDVGYYVTIDPNYGALYAYNDSHELEGTGATWFWSAYGDKIQEYTTVTREYVESNSGTWYYVKHDQQGANEGRWARGERKTYYTLDPSEATEFTTFEYDPDVYRYDGWYEVKADGTEAPYDFGSIVDHDITLKLHWTKNGVFYMEYNPVVEVNGQILAGTLNGEDANEKLYVQLDGEAYADDAYAVVNRIATPPEGYEFAGWTIRGDSSGTVYRPGTSFRLLSSYAVTVQGKRRVYLDAVYTKVQTASIVYYPNGGTVNETAVNDPDKIRDVYGYVATGSKLTPTYSYNSTYHTVTIGNLENNTAIFLSDGLAWLSNYDAIFVGWCANPTYDPDDDSAPLLYPGSQHDGTDLHYNVNASEPTELYAVWQASISYHLNKGSGANEDANASFGDWGSGYTLSGDTYTQNVYLNNRVNKPSSDPTTTTPGSVFRYWATRTGDAGSYTYTPYDFSQPVTGALELYACWAAPLTVTIHAVDASSETIAEKTSSDTDWTFDSPLTVDATPLDLSSGTAGSVTPPTGYAYAFAVVHSGSDLQGIQNKPIQTVYYNSADGKVHVTYAGNVDAALADGESIWFVYYREKTLCVSYMNVASDGAMTGISNLSSNAPTDTGSTPLGSYDMQTELTQPLTWASNFTYTNYAYAIGGASAASISALTLITDASDSEADGGRPALQLNNTWRGFEYSIDNGTSWVSCGYDPNLYVLYYDKQPTVITFRENTLGYSADMGTAFSFSYRIEQSTDSGSTWNTSTPVYDSAASGLNISLRNGEAYSAILFTNGADTQRIIVTQTMESDFSTAVNGSAGNTYTFEATGSAVGESQTATFTNTRNAKTVEVHLSRVNVSGGALVPQDGWRTSTTSFSLALGEATVFSTALPANGFMVSGHEEYAFGAIFYGTDDGSAVTPAGPFAVASIAFEPVSDGDSNVYGVYLKDGDGNRLADLNAHSEYNIYYLYYPKLTIYYMKEGDNGALTQIVGATAGAITYGGQALTLNDQTVSQEQKVEMSQDGLVISQTVNGEHFNMPPLLDLNDKQYDLVYSKIGATAQVAASNVISNTSELGGFISEDLTLYMKIVNNALSWSFVDDPAQYQTISDWPVVYAVYRERGYDLTVKKTVDIDTGYKEPFTVTVSSTAINRTSYASEGTGTNTLSAVPAAGSEPGKITFPVLDGSEVRIMGLGPGTYTVTETEKENYDLRQEVTYKDGIITTTDSAAASTADSVTFTLDKDKTVALTNTPKYICKIGNEYFHTLTEAVQYVIDYSAAFSESIEMLVDYPMPSSDAPEIPSFCDITLTTADPADPFFACSESTAVITRKSTFTSGAMFTNRGTFTLENITLDGNKANVTASASMIENDGTLTVALGATMRNVASSGNGAAVYGWKGVINVTGGTITGCDAAKGGAIYIKEGVATVSGGTISDNTASVDGGAIYYAGSGTVTVSGGTISDNIASVDGGAIYMESGKAIISGGILSSNTAAAGSGGALYAANAFVDVQGGTIKENTAYLNGGALNMDTLTLTISDGILSDNTATTGHGGAVWSGTGTVDISGGTMSDNIATEGNGGAVYAESSSINMSAGSAVRNTANGNGGAIYAGTGAVTLSGTADITYNTATIGDGGGVYAASGAVSMRAGSAANNMANGSGGAIYAGTGAVTLSDAASLASNTATTGDGGGVYASSGTVSMSSTTLTENKASTGHGGALYIGSGTATLTNCTFGGASSDGNAAASGAAIYVDTGSASFSGGSVSYNEAGGSSGAIAVGDAAARLYFSGNIRVENNTGTVSGSSVTSNVYLDQDTDAVINAAGLGGSASIGVYVPDKDVTVTDVIGTTSTVNMFLRRGVPSTQFATYTDNSNMDKFSNDRLLGLDVKAETAASTLYWVSSFTVEVRYLASFANGLPNSSSGTSKKTNDSYDPPASENAASEIAEDLRATYGNGVGSTSAVFGAAFAVSGSMVTPYSEYLTDINWDNSITGSDLPHWDHVRRDESVAAHDTTTVTKLVVLFTEPYYLSIENNAASTLTISSLDLTVNSAPVHVINSSSQTGYGYVFSVNDEVQSELRPVTASDLALDPGDSIRILLPGGKGLSYTLTGSYASVGSSVSYTQTSGNDGSVSTTDPFSITGTTPTAGGATNEIIFGGDRVICRIVTEPFTPAPDSSFVRADAGSDETAGKTEYLFSSPNQAAQFIIANAAHFQTGGKYTATIEMLKDYMIPQSQQIVLSNAGLDITFTTAAGGTNYYPGNEDSLVNRATISRANGNGKPFIDAKDTTASFTSTIRMKDLIFDGKNYDVGTINGGVIASNGWNAEIDHCEFYNCKAENGGGVYIEVYAPAGSNKYYPDPGGGTLTVKDTNFFSCASKSPNNKQGGGAIWSNLKDVTLTNCNFTNCSSIDQGGAVFHRIDGNYASSTTVIGCKFDGCSANAAGSMETDAKNILVDGCTFRNSTAKTRSGGAFNVWALNTDSATVDCYVTVKNSSFENCSATVKDYGGGFRSTATHNTIENCTFTNTKGVNGGAIAVFNKKYAKDLIIKGCTLISCTATAQGGGVYAMVKELTIQGLDVGSGTQQTTIQSCSASSASNSGGGAVYHSSSQTTGTKLSIENSTISDCHAVNQSGGGIWTDANSVEITDSAISGCTSALAGGGVYSYMKLAGTVTLDSATIENCTAGGNGGGVYYTHDKNAQVMLVIQNSSAITGNTSSGQGGGVYTNANTMTLTASEVRENVASGNGGGICYDRDSGTLIIQSGSVIDGNSSRGMGGGVYTIAKTLTLTDSEVNGNTASGNGGGLCHNKDTEDVGYYVLLDASQVTGNTAGGKGGGVYTLANLALKNAVTVTGNLLSSDTATDAAGVYMRNSRNLTIGESGGSAATTVTTIKDNKTESGLASDLRLPEKSGVNDNRVVVCCGTSGEIRVVNAAVKLTQFGTSQIANPAGYTDNNKVFWADDDSLYGIVDRSDDTGQRIIWGADPICKITDATGKLLYLDAEHTRPAVFDKLDVGAETNTGTTSAFSVLRQTSPELYYFNGTKYTGTTYQVKMLVEDYTAEKRIFTPQSVDKTVILTTAGSNDSLYPYRGRVGTRSTILRGFTANTSFVTVKSNLTLTNVVLDGANVTAQGNTRIITAENNFGTGTGIMVTLGRNATLQNAVTTGNGGGVYLNNGNSLTIDGGSIRNCVAAAGGGVWKGGSSLLVMTAGTITNCTATGSTGGGGVYVRDGNFTMSGGSISRCEAANGGGIYMHNGTQAAPRSLFISGGSITGNHVTSSGGGIYAAGNNVRLYFSGAPYVFGNTSDSAATDPTNAGQACNVQMDKTWSPLYNDNPGTIIVSRGLIRGAVIGVYVPENDTGGSSTLYDKHGAEGDPFGTFDGSDAGLNFFINDRNGMKGGRLDTQSTTDKKIYWRIIYTLRVTKEVMSDDESDMERSYSFTVRLGGTAQTTSGSSVVGGTRAEDIDGYIGSYDPVMNMYFVHGVATFNLKSGESKEADLLPLGFSYTVTENLSAEDASSFHTSWIIETGSTVSSGQTLTASGTMDNANVYNYNVTFSNMSAVCKIMEPGKGLLYIVNSEGDTVPAVYSNLAKAFNRVNAGDEREWYYLDGGRFIRTNPTEYRIEMLIPNYQMDYPDRLVGLSAGKIVTLTTADRNASDGFPYVGTGTAQVTRAVTGESMFTISGDLTLDNIILDGNGSSYYGRNNGGIVKVNNGGCLTLGSEVTLQNSTTSADGAGIYLTQDATMNISGNPTFRNNVTTDTLDGATNGTESYSTPRQDIYIAGYSGVNAASLHVTGNLTGTAGSIWVWAAETPHYGQRQQFAVMTDGVTDVSTLNVFRNARTDADANNTTGSYLYGVTHDDDTAKVYWSGSHLRITKKVVSDPEDPDTPFTFTISGVLTSRAYSFTRLTYDADTDTWTAGATSTQTASADGKLTFTLKHHEGIDIHMPSNETVTVTEEDNDRDYVAHYEFDGTPGEAATSQGTELSTSSISMASDSHTVAFINAKSANLAITKIVTGDFGDMTEAFTFTIKGFPGDKSYTYKKYATTNGTDWTEVTSGGGTLNSSNNTFTLTHRQKVVIENLPLATPITVKEEEHGYYTMTVPESAPTNMDTYSNTADSASFKLTGDATLSVTNNLNAVAPTGIAFNTTPFVLMMAMGMLLIPIVLSRRRRRKEE